MLTDSERDFLQRAEEEIDYTCGGPLIPNNDYFLKHIAYIERKKHHSNIHLKVGCQLGVSIKIDT